MQRNSRNYRADIDGLRALAVLLVVTFHLQTPLVHGGFIGVDVFFVISGFLISGIIQKEITSGGFSIARFYERRARRILPALLAVVLVSSVLALHYLLPQELIAYAKSMLGAVFSVSNIYFQATDDYFDAPAQIKPLLHTWSLAVEEQFYLVLPLLLILLSKLKALHRNITLGLCGLVSLAWSAWAAYHAPSAAFYLLPSRAWELLAGTILALGFVPPVRKRWLAEGTAVVGLALIAYSAYHFRATTPFPGLAAIVPCLGALLIIWAGSGSSTFAGTILSLAPIRFIGLISYSMYLWHWPMIVFVRMGFLPWLPGSVVLNRVAVLALTLALGTLSWKFVEQPFRSGRLRAMSPRRLFTISAAAMTCMAGISALFLGLHGLPERFPARAVRIAALSESPEMRVGTCFITSRYTADSYRSDLCLRMDPTRANYLLLGDSHSAMLWPGMHESMRRANILQASTAGCNPVYPASTRNDCGRMMNYIFDDFLSAHVIQGVILAARWTNLEEFRSVQPTVEWLKHRNIPVYLIGPVAEYDAPLPRLLAYSIAFKDPDLAKRHMKREFLTLDRKMRRIAEDAWEVPFISIIDLVCDKDECPQYVDANQTEPFLGDDNHLSSAGSRFVVNRLVASRSFTVLPQP